MGVRAAPHIRNRLIAAGADRASTVIIVENATLATERAIETTLDLLPAAIAAKGIKSPAIIFIGLDWEAAQLSRPDWVEEFDIARHSPSEAPSDRTWTPAAVAEGPHWVDGPAT
jgi:precorrin-4 methylase